MPRTQQKKRLRASRSDSQRAEALCRTTRDGLLESEITIVPLPVATGAQCDQVVQCIVAKFASLN